MRLRVPGGRRRTSVEAVPRRDGFRTDAPEGGPQRQTAEGLHADLRSVGFCPRPRAVLVQFLRLRRDPRAGQYLFQERRRRRESRIGSEGRDRGDLRGRRRLRYAGSRGVQACSATRRFSWLPGRPLAKRSSKHKGSRTLSASATTCSKPSSIILKNSVFKQGLS